jgi:hypothetical protein
MYEYIVQGFTHSTLLFTYRSLTYEELSRNVHLHNFRKTKLSRGKFLHEKREEEN